MKVPAEMNLRSFLATFIPYLQIFTPVTPLTHLKGAMWRMAEVILLFQPYVGTPECQIDDSSTAALHIYVKCHNNAYV